MPTPKSSKDFKSLSRREKLSYLKAIADNAAARVQSNPAEWRAFLRFHAKLYKYPFAEALLIYEQAPHVTACGEVKHWNAVNRRVQRGTKGIPIINAADSTGDIRYVFDIADTYGTVHDIPKQWTLPDNYVEAVVSEILTRFREAPVTTDNTKNLKWAIEQYTRENCLSADATAAPDAFIANLRADIIGSALARHDDFVLQEAYIATVVDSVGYTICERLSLPKGLYDTEEAFTHLTLFDSNAALARLGSTAGQISRSVLILIAKTIQSERTKSHDEHAAIHDRGSHERAGHDSGGNRGTGSQSEQHGQPADHRQVRQSVSDLPAGTTPLPPRASASGNDAARPLPASGQGSAGHDGNVGHAAPRQNAAPEERLSGNDAVRNDHPRPSGGNRSAGHRVQAEIAEGQVDNADADNAEPNNISAPTEATEPNPSLSLLEETAADAAAYVPPNPLFPGSLPADNLMNDRDVFPVFVGIFAEQVKQDAPYQNACRNSDEENALMECKNAVARVMASFGTNDVDLYNAYHGSNEFRKHLIDNVFMETYADLLFDEAEETEKKTELEEATQAEADDIDLSILPAAPRAHALTSEQEALYIREALMNHTPSTNSKERIADYYATTNVTGSAAATFLRRVYGTGGATIAFSDGRSGMVQYDSEGFRITFDHEHTAIKQSWAALAGKLYNLVESGEYSPGSHVYETPQLSLFDVARDMEKATETATETTPPPAAKTRTVIIGLYPPRDHEPQQDSEQGQGPAPATATPSPPTRKPPNFRMTLETTAALSSGGQKTKYARNVVAIRTLKQIESENRYATPDEQATLALYTGWGGVSQAFSEQHADWQSEYSELKELLTEKEYSLARGSTLNAHYTATDVIDGIYKGLERLGFKGGNILEPALGTGNFYACMPEDIAAQSRLYGVELDSLTGRIARQLYPNADIQITGFESAALQDSFFDAAISNVPFGSYYVNDAKYDKHKLYIHDYFIAKALDKVRPEGVIAFITTKGTMDKANTATRRFIAERAELLGAIRLPNNAFKANAGTEVTTDILFLKKRDRMTVADNEPWIHTGTYANNAGEQVPLNEYFIENPHMMLGEMVFDKSMYGNDTETALHPFTSGGNTPTLRDRLMQAVNFLPANAITQMEDLSDLFADDENDGAALSNTLPADPSVKNFCYTVMENGDIYQRNDSRMTKCTFNKTAAERVKAMITMRTITRDILDAQLAGIDDEGLHVLQNKLNTAYDSFYKRFGAINSRYNRNLFREDSDFPLLSSIEELNDDGSTEKSDVFTKRTVLPTKVITHADTATEALAICLNERGCIDIGYMAGLCGKPYTDIISDLRGVIFQNPAIVSYANPAMEDFMLEEDSERNDNGNSNGGAINNGDGNDINNSNNSDTADNNDFIGWETADEYLSGNVKQKLAAAEEAAKENPAFAVNVEALRAVQPKPLEAHEIAVRIGTYWIDAVYYKQFISELLKIPENEQDNLVVDYLGRAGEWTVHMPLNAMRRESIEVTQNYGTNRMDAFTLFNTTLNQQNARIYDYWKDEHGRDKRELNHKDTIAIRERQKSMKEAFHRWIFDDPERRAELCAKYNRMFNSERQRQYDGAHLTFPGMSPEISLRTHQRDAVARGLYGGNSLLAHVVGSGKTYTMAATAMEMKRLGLARKPCFVVPNHLVSQWSNEFQRLYPTTNILAATTKDFEKQKRRRFCARIATGEWDAVIIGHSSFEKIPVSAERQESRLQRDISEIEDAIIEAKENKDESYTIKDLERTLKNMEFQLKKLQDSPKDDLFTFEGLGIDALFVDEAHFYKNKFIFTKMSNVSGLSKARAKKSTDMDMKCEYINELNNGPRGIVFATGTPVSNSMVELYTMMTYLMREELERLGLNHFDNWASVYGEVVSALELAPSGQGYRTKERFAKFVNLPELMTMFRKIADIQTSDMLDLNVPVIQGGKPATIAVDPTPEQKAYTQHLVERAERIQQRKVTPEQDNMLCVTSDGRKAALDIRCIGVEKANANIAALAEAYGTTMFPSLTATDYPDSKVNVCVQNVYDIYNETAEHRLAQMIFCDLSTPKGGAAFSVYDDIRDKLVDMGVAESEIAFIHDANTNEQKEKMFAAVRNGDIRIILGSTSKMGAGTNAQTKLIALHHMDCPYRPSDLEQREGRIVRQGNQNEEVRIFQYVTKNSFDAYLWQIIESKQKFISQIMTGKNPARTMEDVDEMVLNYAEVKAIATGNPMIKRKMELDMEVQRLRVLESQYRATRYAMEDNVLKKYPAKIAELQEIIKGIKEDIPRRDAADVANREIATVLKVKTDGEKDEAAETDDFASDKSAFYIKLGKHEFIERIPAGDMLLNAIESGQYTGKVIGMFRGMEIVPLRMQKLGDTPKIELLGTRTYTVDLSASPLGSITRMDNAINSLEAMRDERIAALAAIQRRLADEREQLKRPFEQEQALQITLTELETVNAALSVDTDEAALVADASDTPQEDVLGLSEDEEAEDCYNDEYEECV